LERGIRSYDHLEKKHGIKPDRYFALRFKVAGKSYEEGLGWSSQGWTLSKARAELARLKEAQRTGQGAISLKESREKAKEQREAEKQEQNLTLQGIFEVGYMAAQHSKSAGAIKAEMQLVRNHIAPFFGDTPLKDITPSKMDEFIKHLLKTKSKRTDKNLAAATIRYCIAIVRQIWNYALSRGLTDVAFPAKRIKAPTVDNKRSRYLSRNEAERLLNTLEKRSQTTHDLALLSLYCGLRAGELFTLQWEDINFEEGTIRVKDRKNKESGTAWMTHKIKKMLEARYAEQKGHEYVFPSSTGAAKNFTSKLFPKVVQELGLNDGVSDRRNRVVFHTLRHTYATWLAQKGVPLHTLAGLLGHKTIAMTQRYAHHDPKGLKAAAMLVDEPK